MNSESTCYACELSAGRAELIGGRIFETAHWLVEHCMGPLGVGTLIVKPRRHVLHVWDLEPRELEEMGPLLGRASRVVRRLTGCEQTYVCLWSHGGFEPVHVHYVVQPVLAEHRQRFESAGPALQVQMFSEGTMPERHLVDAFCRRAAVAFRGDA